MAKIIIAGSSNIDMTVCVKSIPRPGETIGGGKFVQTNGGKGANQAVASGRMGGKPLFLTCVGNDANGHALKEQLTKDGIDTSMMKFSATEPTGVALIYVDEKGENCIAVAPGSNADLLPQDIDAAKEQISQAEWMLLQLEIPMETVCHAVDVAYEAGVKVILNPAPVFPVPEETLSKLYLITPNETEAEKLTGIKVESEEDARRAADVLFAKGVKNVIITMGSAGSMIFTPETQTKVNARKVKAADTTGAGDAYNGALVTGLAEGMTMAEAAELATACSAISVTRVGAQTAVPWRSEIDNI